MKHLKHFSRLNESNNESAVEKIKDSNIIKKLEYVYDAEYIKNPKSRKGGWNLIFQIDKPFGIPFSDNPIFSGNTDMIFTNPGAIKISIEPTKGTISDIKTDFEIVLSENSSEDTIEVFDSLIRKIIKNYMANPWISYSKLFEGEEGLILKEIINFVFFEDEGIGSDAEDAVITDLAKYIIKNPSSFKLVGKSKKFLRLSDKISELLGKDKYDTSLNLSDLGF